MDLIEALNWRYATKRMNGKKISEQDLSTILEAIRLSPSAYGLQPFKVIATDNKDLLEKIYAKSCPQVVIQQASHLLIFKAMKKLDAAYVENYLNELLRIRKASEEYINGYRTKIHLALANPAVNKFGWMIRQTYIALGYGTIAAAMLGIDATPIEGFNSMAMNELLHLDIDCEEAVVLLALGYRDEIEDHLANLPKVRKPMDQLVERL